MKSIADLEAIRKKTLNDLSLRVDREDGIRIVVGMATCGIASGARSVLNALVSEVQKRSLSNVKVIQTGCIGMCKFEPIVEVYVPGKEKVTYIHMDDEKAVQIVSDHIVNNRPVAQYTIGKDE